MIGRAGENGAGAIELFCQHDADQLVRPDRWPEGQDQVRLRQNRTIMAVRAADTEYGFTPPVIAPATDLVGQGPGGQRLAALIQKDEDSTGRQGLGQGAAFIGFRFQGAIVDLELGRRAKADRTAGRGGTREIIIHQFALGAGTDPAVRCQGEFQLAGRRFRIHRPHLLQIVEAADFRAEQVHDNITGIDQHPVAGLQAFNAG